MQKTKKQHFVPQFLLRKFSFNPKAKTRRLHVFDKWTNKSYPNSVGNVGCKNCLYDLDKTSLEPMLEKLESRTSGVIEKLLEAETSGRSSGSPTFRKVNNFITQLKTLLFSH